VSEICTSGRITKDEYERYYQPNYFRTLDELLAPINAPDARLSPLYRLDHAEAYYVKIPFVENYLTSGDAAAFARAFTNFFRAFTEPVLRIAFSSHGDIENLVNDIYAVAERRIREEPQEYKFQYVGVAALLTRL
jgi:gibberellin A4 carboxyl methyltransferase